MAPLATSRGKNVKCNNILITFDNKAIKICSSQSVVKTAKVSKNIILNERVLKKNINYENYKSKKKL